MVRIIERLEDDACLYTSTTGSAACGLLNPIRPAGPDHRDFNRMVYGDTKVLEKFNEVTHFKADGDLCLFLPQDVSGSRIIAYAGNNGLLRNVYAVSIGGRDHTYTDIGSTCWNGVYSTPTLFIGRAIHYSTFNRVECTVTQRRADVRQYEWVVDFPVDKTRSIRTMHSLVIPVASYTGVEAAALEMLFSYDIEGAAHTTPTIRPWNPVSVSVSTNTGGSAWRMTALPNVAEPPIDISKDYGEATRSALTNVPKIKVNMWANIVELTSLTSQAKSVITSVEDLLSRRNIPKALSSLYLADKYGVQTSVRDLQAIGDGVRRLVQPTTNKWLKSQGTAIRSESNYDGNKNAQVSSTIVTTCTVYYKEPTDLVRKYLFDSWNTGFLLTGKNGWDMIPFSFVADWFLNVSTYLEACDVANASQLMDIVQVIYSTKQSNTVTMNGAYSVDGNFYSGILRTSMYQRRCDSSLFLPARELGFSDSEFTHWTESIALAVTNAKR